MNPLVARAKAGRWQRLRAAGRLMHPAGMLTAAADTAAGITVAAALDPGGLSSSVLLLPLAAGLLYGGGGAFIDVCDAAAGEPAAHAAPVQRPSPRQAVLASATLIAAGGFCAGLYDARTMLVALALTAAFLIHALQARVRPWLGAVTAAACRGGTLLLGIAASSGGIADAWSLALVPAVYVLGVVAVSRGGVDPPALTSVAMVAATTMAYGYLAVVRDAWPALGFVALLALLVLPPFIRAARRPSAASAAAAARAGVLGLIVGDAALAASFGGLAAGLAILLLLPASLLLARIFHQE